MGPCSKSSPFPWAQVHPRRAPAALTMTSCQPGSSPANCPGCPPHSWGPSTSLPWCLAQGGGTRRGHQAALAQPASHSFTGLGDLTSSFFILPN